MHHYESRYIISMNETHLKTVNHDDSPGSNRITATLNGLISDHTYKLAVTCELLRQPCLGPPQVFTAATISCSRK